MDKFVLIYLACFIVSGLGLIVSVAWDQTITGVVFGITFIASIVIINQRIDKIKGDERIWKRKQPN